MKISKKTIERIYKIDCYLWSFRQSVLIKHRNISLKFTSLNKMAEKFSICSLQFSFQIDKYSSNSCLNVYKSEIQIFSNMSFSFITIKSLTITSIVCNPAKTSKTSYTYRQPSRLLRSS